MFIYLGYYYVFDKFVVIGIDPDRDRDSLEEAYDQVYANFVEEVDDADSKVFFPHWGCKVCTCMFMSACACVCVCVHVHMTLCVREYAFVCLCVCVCMCLSCEFFSSSIGELSCNIITCLLSLTKALI